MEQDEREWLMSVYEMVGEMLETVRDIKKAVNEPPRETRKPKEDD